MEDSIGYIKIHRSLLTMMWKEARTFSTCEAWLDLVSSARFDASQPAKASIVGREVSYSWGQYPASIRFLAKRWRWTEKGVRLFLERMKSEGRITVDVSQGTSVITICHFEEYSGEMGTQKGTDNEQKIKDLTKEVAHLKAQLAEQAMLLTELGHSEGTKKENNKESSINIELKKVDDALWKAVKRLYPNIDVSFISPEMLPIYARWLTYKSSRKQKYATLSTLRSNYNLLVRYSENDPALAAEIVEKSISNNYQGLVEPKRPKVNPNVAKHTEIDWEKAKTAFNGLGLVSVMVITEERKGKFVDILEAHGKTAIVEVYKKIRASRWLHGENDKQFKADFDFVFTPKNFTRILEGFYDDKSEPQLGIYD